jgi:preprotein translocase subunit SecY
MNGLLFRRAHVVFVIFWGALYLLVTYIIQAVRQGQHLNETPPYAFLTASSALLAAWVFGLLLVLLLFYTCTYQVNRLKIRHSAEDLKEDGIEMPVAKIEDSGA